MARQPVAVRPLEKALAEAARLGVSLDSVRNIHEILQNQRFPDAIRSFDVIVDEDSSGENAIWVIFFVNEDEVKDLSNVRYLNQFGDKIRSSILDNNASHWAYIDFRAA